MWQDKAKCRESDPDLFVMPDRPKRRSEGPKVEQAIAICNQCPVVSECNEAANDWDFLWTVRGGKEPQILNRAPVGSPRGSRHNNRGHDPNYQIMASGARQCRTCERLRDERRAALTEDQVPRPTKPCPRNHPLEDRKFQGGYWKCMTCRKVRDSEASKKRRRGKMAV